MDAEMPAMTLEWVQKLRFTANLCADEDGDVFLPQSIVFQLLDLAERALAAPPVIGDDSLAGDAARCENNDSNSEESPTREAFAWLYQWAGVMNAPAMILDNLSALASGKPALHEWRYPTPLLAAPRTLTREQIREAIERGVSWGNDGSIEDEIIKLIEVEKAEGE